MFPKGRPTKLKAEGLAVTQVKSNGKEILDGEQMAHIQGITEKNTVHENCEEVRVALHVKTVVGKEQERCWKEDVRVRTCRAVGCTDERHDSVWLQSVH